VPSDDGFASGVDGVQLPLHGVHGGPRSASPCEPTRRSRECRLCLKLGDPTAPPERAPARGPPYVASKVVRRALEKRLGQQELFDAA
jgi:hypothetical protein